jgi:hypothetical protein
MKGAIRERWEKLWQSAAEQDPDKLMQLIEQINQLLVAKERRLISQRREGKKLGAPDPCCTSTRDPISTRAFLGGYRCRAI